MDAAGNVVNTSSEGHTTTGVTSTTFSPGSLMLQADLTPGNTLSVTSQIFPLGSSTAISSTTRAVTVNGVESVTVPAGTFTALKFTSVITSTSSSGTTTSSSTMTRWHALGTGLVKEVMQYSGGLTLTLELVSRTTP